MKTQLTRYQRDALRYLLEGNQHAFLTFYKGTTRTALARRNFVTVVERKGGWYYALTDTGRAAAQEASHRA